MSDRNGMGTIAGNSPEKIADTSLYKQKRVIILATNKIEIIHQVNGIFR